MLPLTLRQKSSMITALVVRAYRSSHHNKHTGRSPPVARGVVVAGRPPEGEEASFGSSQRRVALRSSY